MPLKNSLFLAISSALLITYSFTGCAPHRQQSCYQQETPKLSSINIIDRNGMSQIINSPDRLEQYATVNFLEPQPYEKVLRIYTRDSQGNIRSYVNSYHPNGYPKQYLEILNSRACGTYKEWHPNGVLKIEATVLEGSADITPGSENSWIFDGCCQVWNESGNLEAIFPYTKGQLDGIATYYHTNGKVWKCIPYTKNVIDGFVQIFCADGTLLQDYIFCQGKREGEAQRFWSPNHIAAEEIYTEDYLYYGRYYDKCDNCIAQIDSGNGTKAIFSKEAVCELQEYHHGVMEGAVKAFDKYGRINRIYYVKNGCKHGEETVYYDGGRLQKELKPKVSISWYEGKIQGIVKTWYDNGVLESQREMSNNKKNGHNTAWYRDGSLMLIEEYEQDKLTRGEYYNKGDRTPISQVINGEGTATLFDADGNFVHKVEYYHGKPQHED